MLKTELQPNSGESRFKGGLAKHRMPGYPFWIAQGGRLHEICTRFLSFC